jgi:hypothetical protein
MKSPWKLIRRLLLGLPLFLLLILAALGLIFFEEIMPRKDAASFSFRGWTNYGDKQHAILCISNRSDKLITYLADPWSHPKCDLMVITSRQMQGNREFITLSNLLQHSSVRYAQLFLLPHRSLYFRLPWRDDYTNGTLTVSYAPEPNLVQRTYQNVSRLWARRSLQRWETVALTDAPWTNAAATPWPRAD